MAGNTVVSPPHLLHGPDDWIRRYYDFFLQRGNSRPGHVLDDQGGSSVSDREIERLRSFYQGLTGELEKCRKYVFDTQSIVEGLMHLCQDHLTIIGELEQGNADLRRENRNLKIKLNETMKGDNQCSHLSLA